MWQTPRKRTRRCMALNLQQGVTRVTRTMKIWEKKRDIARRYEALQTQDVAEQHEENSSKQKKFAGLKNSLSENAPSLGAIAGTESSIVQRIARVEKEAHPQAPASSKRLVVVQFQP